MNCSQALLNSVGAEPRGTPTPRSLPKRCESFSTPRSRSPRPLTRSGARDMTWHESDGTSVQHHRQFRAVAGDHCGAPAEPFRARRPYLGSRERTSLASAAAPFVSGSRGRDEAENPTAVEAVALPQPPRCAFQRGAPSTQGGVSECCAPSCCAPSRRYLPLSSRSGFSSCWQGLHSLSACSRREADHLPSARSVISEMFVRLCPSTVPNFEIHTSTLDVSV